VNAIQGVDQPGRVGGWLRGNKGEGPKPDSAEATIAHVETPGGVPVAKPDDACTPAADTYEKFDSLVSTLSRVAGPVLLVAAVLGLGLLIIT
jgi:hypothetical protein